MVNIVKLLEELWRRLTHIKRPEFFSYERPLFEQVYDFVDCCSWGTGIMMGAGVFMYLPIIIKYVAGPSTVLSYIVGGAIVYTCVFAFAELSSRFPHCGGTYVYNYAIFGEFAASIMGISLLFQHLIIAADICISLSEHIDYFVFNRSLEEFEEKEFSYNVQGSTILASYPHFFASLILVLISVVLTTKSKYNNMIGSCANFISFLMVFMIVFVGAFYIDFDNWFKVEGGFFPYGYTSVFRGAIVIMSTYLGFVELPCVSDEALNPAVDVGRAAHSSFFFVLCIYIAVSTVVSLLVPYSHVQTNFAMANIFIEIGADWMKYCVEIGSIAALFSTAMCVLQAASRLAFSMGKDGVILPCFGLLQQKSKIPFNAVMWCGFVGAIVPLFFDSTYLIRLAETGYMLSCILANLGILVLRYSVRPIPPQPELAGNLGCKKCQPSSCVTKKSEERAKWCMGLCSVWVTGCMLSYNYGRQLMPWLGQYGCAYLSLMFLSLMVVQTFFLSLLPQNPKDCVYFTPWVPWLPMTSVYLTAWVIFQESPVFFWEAEALLLAIALLIYVCYSFWHTDHRDPDDDEGEKEVLTIAPQNSYQSGAQRNTTAQPPGQPIANTTQTCKPILIRARARSRSS